MTSNVVDFEDILNNGFVGMAHKLSGCWYGLIGSINDGTSAVEEICCGNSDEVCRPAGQRWIGGLEFEYLLRQVSEECCHLLGCDKAPSAFVDALRGVEDC